MTAPRWGGVVARAATGLQVEIRQQPPGRPDVREQHRPGVEPGVALDDPGAGHRVAAHQAPAAEDAQGHGPAHAAAVIAHSDEPDTPD